MAAPLSLSPKPVTRAVDPVDAGLIPIAKKERRRPRPRKPPVLALSNRLAPRWQLVVSRRKQSFALDASGATASAHKAALIAHVETPPTSAALRVVASAVPVDDDRRLLRHDPDVVPAEQVGDVAGPGDHLGAVIHSDREARGGSLATDVNDHSAVVRPERG